MTTINRSLKIALWPLLVVLAVIPVLSQPRSNYTLLWQINGNGSKAPSYLFGSAHVKDNRAFQFSDSVMLALDACDLFALELHPDSAVRAALAYRQKIKLHPKNHQLTSEQAAEVIKRYEAEYGHTPDSSILNNPLLIEHLMRPVASKPDDRISTVDTYLLGIALTRHKHLRGLEHIDDLSTRFGADKSLSGLFTDDKGTHDAMLEEVLSAYGTGDLDKLWRVIGRYATADTTLKRRNVEMTESIIQLMDEGSLFAVAGVAHLPGEQGIIALLRNAGFTVRPVEATFTGLAGQYAVDVSAMRWHPVKDSIYAYQIDLPPGHFHYERSGLSSSLQYMDLINASELHVSTRIVGPAGTIDADEYLEQELDRYVATKKVSLLKRRFFKKNGIPALEMEMRVGRNYERAQVFIRDNIQYTLSLLYTSEKVDPALPSRFFDSFALLPFAPHDTPQAIFKHPVGAFEIRFPTIPEKTVSELENPNFPNHEPLKLHLFSAFDREKHALYVVRYSDFPTGMYLMNKEIAIDGLIQHAVGLGELIGTTNEVVRAGLVGKAAAIKSKDGGLVDMEVFTRGNRVYLLMRNSISGIRPVNDDHFFSSFNILPIEPTTFHPYALAAVATEVPGTPVIQPADPDDTSPIITTSQSAYTFDPNSGTVYGMENLIFAAFAKFDVDTFYSDIINNMLDDDDAIVEDLDIIIDGQPGKEYHTERAVAGTGNRIRMWVSGDTFIILQALGSRAHIHGSETDRFFDKAYATPNNPSFDAHTSKAAAIIRDLRSADTAAQSQAHQALHYYYTFDSTEVVYLREALGYSYADDDSVSQNTRRQLISELATLRDRESAPALQGLFDDDSTSGPIKAAVLEHITTLDSTTFDWYFNTLTTNPPTEPNWNYALLSPLYDSLSYVAQHFEQLAPLLDVDHYRPYILSLATSMVHADTLASRRLSNAAKVHLTQHALSDLDTFLNQLGQTDVYPNYGAMYSYLNLLPEFGTAASVQAFTTPLLTLEDNIQLQASAVAACIRTGIRVTDEILYARLDDLSTRREILTAFHRVGQLDQVPVVYFTNEAIAALSLFDYAVNYYDYPESANLLGLLSQGEDSYYAMEWTWLDYEGNVLRYIGICKSTDLAFTDGQFELYPCYSDFEEVELETDWKAYAEKLIALMLDAG
ncbi:TraB/GumN family protein [Parapedobacter sp. 2B3]|uniref:TraB/GumN family protein n=1 Tax=Parapedobacter sp. 2B3 TaxID=3342381 RepID=UPI0035B69380